MSSTPGDVINQSTTRNVTNNSTTGYVINQTDVKLTFRPGSVSHGNDPTIETQSLDPGNYGNGLYRAERRSRGRGQCHGRRGRGNFRFVLR